jgi:hypothetical protein
MQPTIDRVAAKLPTWKAHLMDKAGRLKLVKSVLSAIPIHQLLVHAPDKQTLHLIEKIERGFLWAGRKEAHGGNCHVNWGTVCRPIDRGGLGVLNLDKAGIALRLRWLWLSRTDPSRAWQGLDLQFSPLERSLFFASTTMVLGDGRTALFWEDRWLDGRSISEIAPLLYACIPKRRRRIRMVADGLLNHSWARDIHGTIGIPEIGEYLLLWRRLESVQLTDQADAMTWKWNDSGVYSAKSCYNAMFLGSTSCSTWRLTWRTWAPQSVKFFTWLANLDRCWTAARLQRRGLQHHPRCLLCDQEMETMHHLLTGCCFSQQVWFEVLAWLRATCNPPERDDSIHIWWHKARQSSPAPTHKGLASITLLVPWMLWKHRNDCVFNGARPSINTVINNIKEVAALWARAGAQGLRVILPQTWDVH